MDLSMLLKRVGKVAADNTPAILTALGVSGTLTTALLAAKGAFRSVEVLNDAASDKTMTYLEENPDVPADDHPDLELTTKEKVEAVWHLYAPAATSAALTIAAIILAARVQERRNAALASAYTVVEKSYAEYRAKNVEKFGKKKEQELRDAIAQDKADRLPTSQSTLIVTGKGDHLCQDAWSGRYFTSNKNLVDRAVNDFNALLMKNSYASLSEFWSLLGIPPTTESDYIGWRSDKHLEIEHSGVVDETGEPALSFSFRVLPDARFASAY
jgi:hypothetical protein